MQTTVSSKGQIVLPDWTMDKLGLKGGECFQIEEDGDDIVLRRLYPLRRYQDGEEYLA